MTETLKCPNRPRLHELLAGSLPAREQNDLVAHLDTCVMCQETLELMAVGDRPPPWPVGETAPIVGAAPIEPTLDRAIKALELRVGFSGAAANDSTDNDLPLACLDPPREPSHLGRLGRYGVLKVIRRGGMGWILKAFDPKLNRTVAIKVIAPDLVSSPAARQRFAREAQAAGTIHDDHVVAIHSIEETDQGIPYLVMEYIEGKSLQDRLDAGGLELPEIITIGIQVARGLAAAHAKGVVHRDIKPGNIMLDAVRDRVLITDFGLARAVDDVSVTQSGVVAGTPQYMAPEQARGEVVDDRADLFSLGSVLYAMCTGQPPFLASGTLAVLNQIREESPPSIQGINPEIPEWLVQLIAKLHIKRPDGRFATATEVATALERQILRPASRRRLPKWAAAILLALMGLVVTEATHITNLAATVIRIVTPHGTLAVEIDDPAIKVTIENDGKEVVVTGPGIQEVRLRVGDHKIQATRDGKALPLPNDVVTITRGDKQVVRVRREEPQAAPPMAAEAKLLVELAGYDATLKENPKDLATLLKRGDVLRRLKRFDDAVAALSQVIMNSSNQAERYLALTYRALTHAERGHLQGTIDDYEESVRDGAEVAWIYGRLATCYLFGPEKLRNPKRALEHAETAIQKRGAHADYHTLHGVCLYRLGRHREAIEVLERANEDKGKNKDGRTAMNRFFAAMAYQSLGEPAKAQANYALALKLPQPTGHPGLIPDWVEQMRAEAAQLLGLANPGK